MESYTLHPPSQEQNEAIQSFQNHNILVDSVAGSGKTTLCLHLAQQNPHSSILLLTYNAKLKLETRQKVERLGIHNLEVHSYHSFCVKYFSHDCFTDSGILDYFKQSNPTLYRPVDFDCIIVDEAQDMSPLYYELVCKLIKDNQKEYRMCIMGDKNQSIYQFNHADERYIQFGHQLFINPWNDKEWTHHKLSQSFRITHPMAEFLNHAFLKEPRLRSQKQNTKPRYIICDSFGSQIGSSNRVYREVKHYLQQGYQFEDIFILAPSVKSEKSPVRQLANQLSQEGIPIHVPVSDESKLDEDILKGKIVFSSFHQVKGLERKVVIVFNMDASYFEFFKKDVNPLQCPNEIYVACTRASEKLTLIHHYQNDYLPFVDIRKIEEYSQFEKSRIHKTQSRKKKNFKTTVTDFIKHLPIEVIHHCMTFFRSTEIKPASNFIDVPIKTKQKKLFESVAEITGIAIPNFYEFAKTGKMSIYHRCKEELQEMEKEMDSSTPQVSLFDVTTPILSLEQEEQIKLNKINFQQLTSSDLLYISNLWNSLKTGFIYKLNQIKKYDWLTPEHLSSCMERLEDKISNQLKTEVEYVLEDVPELKNRKLVGHIDCIDNQNIWEFKCTQQLENEHHIQLAVYMYLFLKNKQKKPLVFSFEDDFSLEDDMQEDLEEKLILHESILASTLESPPQMNDMIDFVQNEIEYKEWKIEKQYKNGRLEVKKGKESKKIEVEDIVLNATLQRKVEKLEKEIEKIKKEIQGDEYHFYLYNILSDQQIEITSTLPELEKMIDYLIFHKYFMKNFITDDQFKEKNQLILSKYC